MVRFCVIYARSKLKLVKMHKFIVHTFSFFANNLVNSMSTVPKISSYYFSANNVLKDFSNDIKNNEY